MENTTISLIALFPENKEQLKSFTDSVINYVTSGSASALKTDVRLKVMEESIKLIRDGIKADVIAEAEKESSDKPFSFMGIKSIQITSRATWNYSKCAYHEELKEKENEAKENVKRVEKIMQVIGVAVADVETGEILEPATQTSTKSIVYKL